MLLIMTVQTYREAENNVPDVPNSAPPPLNKIPYKRGQHIIIGSIIILAVYIDVLRRQFGTRR